MGSYLNPQRSSIDLLFQYATVASREIKRHKHYNFSTFTYLIFKLKLNMVLFTKRVTKAR